MTSVGNQQNADINNHSNNVQANALRSSQASLVSEIRAMGAYRTRDRVHGGRAQHRARIDSEI
jgi:hypothetical protein